MKKELMGKEEIEEYLGSINYDARNDKKSAYINDPSEKNLESLISELDNKVVFIIMEWNLTEEEEDRFRNAEIGDTIHIDTESIPAMWEDDDGRILVPVYSSENEIDEEHKHEYSLSTRTFAHMARFSCEISKELKRDVAILLDGDGDESVEFSIDVLKEYCMRKESSQV